MNELKGTIQWRGYVRVKDKEQAFERFDTMRNLIGREVELVSCERYWKIKELFEIVFTSTWTCDSVEKAVFDALVLSRNIQNGWCLSGPNIYQNGVVELEGLFNHDGRHTNIPNLEWIIYQLFINTETETLI